MVACDDRATSTASTARSCSSTSRAPSSASTGPSDASQAARSAADRSSSTGSRRPAKRRRHRRHEPTRQTDPELDSLIAEITVDCHDDDEALTAFENAFDEDASFPIPSNPHRQDVESLWIGARNGRRELIATRRHAQKHDVALLDINIHPTQPASCLLTAHRHWLGALTPHLTSDGRDANFGTSEGYGWGRESVPFTFSGF